MPNQEFLKHTGRYLSELEQLFNHNEITGLSVVLVLRNGDVRHLMTAEDGQRMVLLCADDLALDAIRDQIKASAADQESSRAQD